MKIKEVDIPDLIKNGHYREVIPLLYKKVFPFVKKYVKKNGGAEEDSFDSFQDALLEFYVQVTNSTYDRKYKVYGYLFKSSIHKWINKVKRDRKFVLKDTLADYEEHPDNSIEFEFLGKNENLLKTLFSAIGDKCIELLTFTIYYNLMIEDIQLRMNFSSVSAVKMQQQRCKQKLMKEIEDNPEIIKILKGYE